MRYQGGKSFSAKHIAPIISEKANGKCFVSLFCGCCAVESKVAGYTRIILNDKHKYLISMLKGVQAGYELPDTITEEQYKYIRQHKDEDPVLTGFVGFASSYGGRWFEGYARGGNRNYTAESKRSLLRDMKTLLSAEITCGDYRTVEIPPNSVIYADPPYANTKQYGEKFDSEAFWEYMRALAKDGHIVYVSELKAPSDFDCIWSREQRRSMDNSRDNNFAVTEKLFTYQ